MIPPASVNLAALRARKSLAIDTEPRRGTIAQIEGNGSQYAPQLSVFPRPTLNLAEGDSLVSQHAHSVAARLYGVGAMASMAETADLYPIAPWRLNWLGASSQPMERPRWLTEPPIVACCAWAMEDQGGLLGAISGRIAWITSRQRVQVVTGTPPVGHPNRIIPSAVSECIVAGITGQDADLTVPVSHSSWAVPIVAGAYYLLAREAMAMHDSPHGAAPEVIRACLLAGRKPARALDIDAASMVHESGQRQPAGLMPGIGWTWAPDGNAELTVHTGTSGMLQASFAFTRPVSETPGAAGTTLAVVHEIEYTVQIASVGCLIGRSSVMSSPVGAGQHMIRVASSHKHPLAIAWRFVPDIAPPPPPPGATLGGMLAAWGGADPTHDLNGDGIVDGADLGIMLDEWEHQQ